MPQQLIGAKSVQQALEIQSEYSKKAYETYIAEMSKRSGDGAPRATPQIDFRYSIRSIFSCSVRFV